MLLGVSGCKEQACSQSAQSSLQMDYWQVHPVQVKKLYVLAAVEVECFRKRVLNQTESLTTMATGASPTTIAQPTTAQTLAGLILMKYA